MAYKHVANTILVGGSGDTEVPGPLDILGVAAPAPVTILKNGEVFLTLQAGFTAIPFRSSTSLTIQGSCTLTLRTSKTKGVSQNGGVMGAVGSVPDLATYSALFNNDFSEDFNDA